MSAKKGNRGKQNNEPNVPTNGEEIIQLRARTNAEKTPGKAASERTTPAAITTPADLDSVAPDIRAFILQALNAQTEQIVSRVDMITREIKDLHDETSDILESVKHNAEQIETNASEIEKLRQALSDTKRDFENRFVLQELYSRKNNLLVYGIPDGRDPEESIRELISLLGVTKAEHMQFVNVHRLPRTSTDPTNFRANMPKPVVIKFVKFSDRQAVFNAAMKGWAILKPKRITVRTDLPVVLKKQRGRLANRAFELHKSHKVQTRIQERGVDIYLQIRKNPQDNWKNIAIDENP